jgi:uncharacterized membrane protein HdeD (DUF308 family)
LLALFFTVGFYAIFAGIAMIALSFRLKSLAGSHQPHQHAAA